ncbi:MAG: VOC family protein [Gammaproteobacteria bacterium]|nr:VOC family protein [Gammaproteobacteria bacterium]
MKFTHVSIVARDTNKLADFYKEVFRCEDLFPRDHMSGEALSRGNGVPNAEIFGAWLSLPGVDGPFLEIFQYKNFEDCQPLAVNRRGIGHISFDVEDLKVTYDAVIAAGGSAESEITRFESDSPFDYVYMRDPEGNILDLKQHY